MDASESLAIFIPLLLRGKVNSAQAPMIWYLASKLSSYKVAVLLGAPCATNYPIAQWSWAIKMVPLVI